MITRNIQKSVRSFTREQACSGEALAAHFLDNTRLVLIAKEFIYECA